MAICLNSVVKLSSKMRYSRTLIKLAMMKNKGQRKKKDNTKVFLDFHTQPLRGKTPATFLEGNSTSDC